MDPCAPAENPLYLELFKWLEALLKQKRSKFERGRSGIEPSGPLFVGVNAPQGAGKTTLTRNLVERFEREGLKALSLSIDDFYLTRAEQVALAAHHAGNPLLQARGYPGTHDIALGVQTLTALQARDAHDVALPSYDKSAQSGRGDRRPRSEWNLVRTPVDLVLLEGWMLGYSPVAESALPNSHFHFVNEALRKYEPWLRPLEAFVHLKPEKLHFINDWRIEAEARMRAEGKDGMTDAEVAAYIATFIPAYETYLEPFAQTLASRWPHSKLITIGRDRRPIGGSQ
jgi:D-glycerate 3-kinase